MSDKSDELHWRETYFVLFSQKRRPDLDQVVAAISEANPRFEIENPEADESGKFASLLVESPDDHAAVEISYEVGEAITEQSLQWAEQVRDQLDSEQLRAMVQADARLDVAHFERVPSEAPQPTDAPSPFFGDEFDDEDEAIFNMLDPTCMLTVIDILARLTGGITFDPASGEIVS